MKYFWTCCFYIAAIGCAGFLIGRLLPKRWFRYDAFPYRPFRFEKNGKRYAALGVQRWKDRLPDMSRILPQMMPSKRLSKAPEIKEIARMIQETCVAETTHFFLAVAGFYCIWLWPGAGGLVMAICNLMGNIPYLIIQRYNRPRLVRLLSALGEKTAERRKKGACADPQL